MYRYMWSIGAKEHMEFADYSFKEHFGKLLPSFVPREIINQYLTGRWTRGKCGNMRPLVNFQHGVSSVDYRAESDDFSVLVKDLKTSINEMEIFSHVIVASGKFTYPYFPDIPGLKTFQGQVFHSKYFNDAVEFKGQTVLIVGAGHSAQDIAIELIKYGAKQVHISVKGNSMGLKFPNGVDEHPILQRADEKTVYFSDGSFAEVDVIILCTGYIYHYPFLKGDLSVEHNLHTNSYPDNLYKGTLWTKGGNNKLFFMDQLEIYFSLSVLAMQSEWIVRYIMESIPNEPVSKEDMLSLIRKQLDRASKLQTWRERVAFMKDIMLVFARDIDFPIKTVDAINEIIVQTMADRFEDIWTYRNKRFRSMFTGELMPAHDTKWADTLDDSADSFVQ